MVKRRQDMACGQAYQSECCILVELGQRAVYLGRTGQEGCDLQDAEIQTSATVKQRGEAD